MDFKKLIQKMQYIDEGIESSIDECGEMPAIIQSSNPPEESLNMNLTINSKGADGIRELIDVLKGIGGDTEPKDIPHDHDSEIVIGDSYGNEIKGDAGPKVFGVDALLHQGDKKDRETIKVNGGGNPQVQESLYQSLHSLYEEIKSRPSRVSVKEDQAAIDAWLADPNNRIKHGKTKRTKKDRMIGLLPGEHKEGGIRSADAKLPPKRATKHDHVDVAAKPQYTPDWEAKLDALAAIGNDPKWKQQQEEEKARQARIERHREMQKDFDQRKRSEEHTSELQSH